MAVEPPAPALTSKESEQLSALKKIENRHMCQQHKKPCFVQADGEHYQLTMNDITKWAHLMVRLLYFYLLSSLLIVHRLRTKPFSIPHLTTSS